MACGCQKNKARPQTAASAAVTNEQLLEVVDQYGAIKHRTRSMAEAERRKSKIAGSRIRVAGQP